LPRFHHYLGIDYSGAGTPDDPLPGLCAYFATVDSPPRKLKPASGRRWSRLAITQCVIDLLREKPNTIVGIDHGFSFPDRYFVHHGLPRDWNSFLLDFVSHWPSDRHALRIIRDGRAGAAAKRRGDPRWKRACELACPSAKSVFLFDVNGTVAHSTHAGLSHLDRIRRELPDVHFWPFDGWNPPRGRSVVFEAYPRLYSAAYAQCARTGDEHDAYSITRWLRESDATSALQRAFEPELTAKQRELGLHEGWILGVRGSGKSLT
jgi:hypothetical protein